VRLRAPGIRWLLLAGNALVLALPLFALAALRIYDGYLLRQTERQLIAEAVVVGEAWRAAYLAARGEPDAQPEIRPPRQQRSLLTPIEPVADLGVRLAPPQPPGVFRGLPPEGPELTAARAVTPLLRRVQRFNLSALRLLDAEGCVLATTRGEEQQCLGHLPEVRQALDGRYSSVARRRTVHDPPPLSGIQRRGEVRLFSALPLFHDGRVVAVVRSSRTSLDALTSLWQNRRGLLLAGGASLLVTALLSLLLSRAVAGPLGEITRAARAIARGEAARPLPRGRCAPAELRELGEALDSMTRQLASRAREVERFASDVGHELKAPLTAVRGAVELLREHWPEMAPEQRERFLTNIGEDGTRMERLVTQLLQLARIERAPEAEMDVPVAEACTALLARTPGRVELQLDAPPPTLRIHPDHFASALGNLLDNALRHGGEQPVRLRLGRGPAGRLQIDVTDHGPGIPEAIRPRLFERFFTTERDRGGTGLGLAIVRALAEARGGSISFTSDPAGTTFTLIL